MSQEDLHDPILMDENCGYKDRYVNWRWNPLRWRFYWLNEHDNPVITPLVISRWKTLWVGPLTMSFRECEPNPEAYTKKQLKAREEHLKSLGQKRRHT